MHHKKSDPINGCERDFSHVVLSTFIDTCQSIKKESLCLIGLRSDFY